MNRSRSKATPRVRQGSWHFPVPWSPALHRRLIYSGGVVDAGGSWDGRDLAPGRFCSIYGADMAGATTFAESAVFPTSLGNVQASLGGEALPLFFTAAGQIDAIVPFDLAVDGTRPVRSCRMEDALSQPEPVAVAAVAPAVFTRSRSGRGPGAVQGLKPGGNPVLNAPSDPSSAGDALIIYAARGREPCIPPLRPGRPHRLRPFHTPTTRSTADDRRPKCDGPLRGAGARLRGTLSGECHRAFGRPCLRSCAGGVDAEAGYRALPLQCRFT